VELLPRKATFAPDEPLVLDAAGVVGRGEVRLLRLDEEVALARVRAGARRVELPPQPEGGYGIELGLGSGARWNGALDVLADPLRRPRYGFVSRFDAGRDPGPVVEHARRFHLNVVQFYDWMYRHASLLPPRPRFRDALGRELSLTTVRRLAAGLRAAGSAPLGYAAVYAVGRDELPRWEHALLLDGAGKPWTLGKDFLWIVDPSDRDWSRQFGRELRAALDVGFAGFHLDQYGAPQRALRRDGTEVDLADAFPRLIRSVRRAVPDARLIFNNVNHFPTWTTARAPVDVVYVEVWPPHTTLAHLVDLVARARALAPGKPVVLAAYLSCFGRAPEREGVAAAQLLTATVASSGGFHLLHGEEGAVLIDPYYPNHHRLGASAVRALQPWQDFAVRYGDLLHDERAVDVTRAVTGGINEELRVEAPVPVATDPVAGSLWVRVVETAEGRVVHLVDLSAQTTDGWDEPKTPLRRLAGVSLRVTSSSAAVAQPHTPGLRSLKAERSGRSATFALPAIRGWAVVLLRGRLPERRPVRCAPPARV
jgi:dextranase